MTTKKFSLGSRQQQGAILFVSLIMVLLISIAGLSAIRGSNLQELMAGNMRDRNLAFQAAEAGLRAGEFSVSAHVISLPAFNNADGYFDNLNGVNTFPPSTWSLTDWQNNAAATAMSLPLISDQPRYVVEKIIVPITISAALDGSGIDASSLDSFEESEFFRVTSRGTGGTENAAVILQSVYKR